MSDDTQSQAAAPTLGRFLAETAIYFTVVSTLFLVFDFAIAGLIAGGGLLSAIAVQMIWSYVKGPKPAKDMRFPNFLAGIYAGAGGVAGILVIIGTAMLWLNFGLDLEKTSAGMSGGLFDGRIRGIGYGLTAAALFALLSYFLPLAVLRRRGFISGSFLSFVRADLVGFFRSPLIPGIAMLFALVGFLVSLATLAGAGPLVAELFPDKHTGLMDVGALLPVLPIGLLASCMLMSIARPASSYNKGYVAELASHFGPGVPGWRRWPAWQGMITTVASIVVVVAVVYPIHFGLVVTLTVIEGIGPWSSITDAVDEWVTAEGERGRGSEEIAADLNRHGTWPDAPGEGLTALIPGLEDGLSYNTDSKCVAELAAAPLDPQALAGADWIPEDYAGRTLAYCLRVACPSPVAWDAPAPVILSSSHPSQNYMWMQHVFIDVFAHGAAPEPGGFCTTDGKLTEEFQG
jgi:hypothetical protein